MSIISRMRKQKAVYWRRLEADEYGKYSFDDPVEINCRWDDDSREERKPGAEVFITAAVVYVDREMSEGDMLQKGEISSDERADPHAKNPDGNQAYEIMKFKITPNLKNTENLYTAML